MVNKSKEKDIPERMSKELKGIQNAIEKYVDKHNGDVIFHGSFMAFKGKDAEIVDDMIFCFGPKEPIKISLDEMKKALKEEKGDFINW
jgi:hypothetical protein